tara:strand:- start:122 stop:1213 length:1092 start_codon:yes stop_codon:yes gene_type:complete
VVETLHLDLTSYSNTFNSISPQGQWFCNRVGKRDYPIQECNFDLLKEFITNNNPKKIFCNSFYGDSLEYTKILDLAKLCDQLEIELLVFTSGSNSDKDLIEELLIYNTSFYLFLHGINDNANKVSLNVNWKEIEKFLKQTKNKTIIEFQCYKHNVNDIYEILKICEANSNNIKITKGNKFNEDVTNIFDEQGNWLYDLMHIQEDLPLEDQFLYDVTKALELYKNLQIEQKDLYRTTLGYISVRFFYKKDLGENILEIQLPNLSDEYPLELIYNEEVFINSTGHIFCDRESYEVFNNCLSTDWSSKILTYISDNVSLFRKSGRHNLYENESRYMKDVLFKHIFYFQKNRNKCLLENNLEKFYWN